MSLAELSLSHVFAHFDHLLNTPTLPTSSLPSLPSSRNTHRSNRTNRSIILKPTPKPSLTFDRIRSPTVTATTLPSISQAIMPTEYLNQDSLTVDPMNPSPSVSLIDSMDSLQAALLNTLNQPPSQPHSRQLSGSHPPEPLPQSSSHPSNNPIHSISQSPHSINFFGPVFPAHQQADSDHRNPTIDPAQQPSITPSEGLVLHSGANVPSHTPQTPKPSQDLPIPTPDTQTNNDMPFDSAASQLGNPTVCSTNPQEGSLPIANDFLSGSPAPTHTPPSGPAHPQVQSSSISPKSQVVQPVTFSPALPTISQLSNPDSSTPFHSQPSQSFRPTANDPQASTSTQTIPIKAKEIPVEDTRMNKYLAIHLVDQIKNKPDTFLDRSPGHSPSSRRGNNPNRDHTQSEPTSHKRQSSHQSSVLASPHHPPSVSSDKLLSNSNVGLSINSSFPPQELVISTTQVNQEILYTADPPPHVLPITLFPSNMVFSPGRKVAVDGFISYATKAGRIRVIDQNSGARMLLRKHEGPVTDMCIGQPRGNVGDASNSSRRWRCIASTGSDGRLVIWKVPVRFQEDTAGYEVLVDVLSVESELLLGPEKQLQSPRSERFTAVRWHPRDPSIFLVSTNDRRLVLVRLDRGAFGAMWKRGMPLGKTVSELEAFEGQDVLRTSSDVAAFAFSPDGSAFAFVTQDNILTVRQTCKPHWTIMGGQLPQNNTQISRLEFLSTPQGLIKGFLISKKFGTRVEAVQLSEISQVVVAINLQPPEPADEDQLPCFGHVAWQPQYSSILLSNSLRGSIFAFHINFCQAFDDDEMLILKSAAKIGNGRLPHHEDDAAYIERIAATRQSSQMQRSRSNSWVASRTMFVDHISEVPSPDPIISFVLDEGMRPAPGPSSSNCSIFNLHPKGIHQLYLPKEVIDRKDPLDDEFPTSMVPTRSLSLAGEILVDVRVEREVAPAEVLEFSQDHSQQSHLSTPNNNFPPASKPNAGVKNLQTDKQLTTESLNHTDPLRRDYVGNHASQASKSKAPQSGPFSSASHAHNFEPKPASHGPTPSPSHISRKGSHTSGQTSEGSILRTLEHTRETLKLELQSLIAQGMEKQDQKLQKQFIAHQELERRHHDDLMDFVSSNLNKNTSKLIEQTIRNEVRGSLLAEVTSALDRSLHEHVRRGLQDSLKKHLGHEIEGALKKPNTIGLIVNLVSDIILREVGEKIEGAMSQVMLPILKEVSKTQQASSKSLAQDVNQLVTELRDLRAQAQDKQEIVELRSTVESMKHQMGDLQECLKQVLAGQHSSTTYPHPHLREKSHKGSPQAGGANVMGSLHAWPNSELGASLHVSPQLYSQQTSEGVSGSGASSGAVPFAGTDRNSAGTSARVQTPTGAYEDMFLEALSDPSARSLSKLIDDGSHDPLESVFHRHRDGAPLHSPVLSQPVVLTLAHRLSEEIANPAALDPISNLPDNPRTLGTLGTNRLRWIWSCVGSVDHQDSQTRQYLDRVLDLCWHNLDARKAKLIENDGLKEEIGGINEVLKIIHEKIAMVHRFNGAANLNEPGQ